MAHDRVNHSFPWWCFTFPTLCGEILRPSWSSCFTFTRQGSQSIDNSHRFERQQSVSYVDRKRHTRRQRIRSEDRFCAPAQKSTNGKCHDSNSYDRCARRHTTRNFEQLTRCTIQSFTVCMCDQPSRWILISRIYDTDLDVDDIIGRAMGVCDSRRMYSHTAALQPYSISFFVQSMAAHAQTLHKSHIQFVHQLDSVCLCSLESFVFGARNHRPNRSVFWTYVGEYGGWCGAE